MASQELWIPGRLPGWNELLDAKGRRLKRGRKTIHKSIYDLLKAKHQSEIVRLARSQLKPCNRVRLHYEFHEPDKRRDPGNVLGGVIKLTDDALVVAGIIPNDGWRHIAGYTVDFVHDKERAGVLVTIEDV